MEKALRCGRCCSEESIHVRDKVSALRVPEMACMNVHGRAWCSPLPSRKHRFNAATLSPEISRCPHKAVRSLQCLGALSVGRSSEALLACSTAQPLLHAKCENHLVCLRSTPGTSRVVARIYWDLDNLVPLPGPQGLRTLTTLKASSGMALHKRSALMTAFPWHHEKCMRSPAEGPSQEPSSRDICVLAGMYGKSMR